MWRFLLVIVMLCSTAAAQESAIPKFTLVEWNIEAGGSDVEIIAKQLAELEPFDLVALSEVPTASAERFAARWGKENSLVGTSGGPARLVVAWNPKVLTKVQASEIKSVGQQEFAPGLQMAPLSIQLKHSASGQEFLLIMTHLARGSAELRKKQALLMTELAQQQSLPVLAIGGFNFDYDFVKQQGNESFAAFTAGDTWKWIKPKEWVDSNWSDRNRDGQDDYPDSMLDYVFVTGQAKQWPIECEIVVRPGDFPDTDRTSDHRPVRCKIGS